CGKTTTLRLIAGLEMANSGSIFIGDEDVTRLAATERDVSMVFQSYALYPTMNVSENIAFPLRVRKVGSREIQRRVEETAALLDIGKLLRRRPRELSGGERQRVALGRAIIREPKVFLLDEPLSNLDANLRMQTRQELKRLHGLLGATFIYVTHDQDDALAMGDQVAVLSQGRLEQYADTSEVYNAPANRFVASFIGRPPMNFFQGEVAREEGGVAFRNADMSLPLPAAMQVDSVAGEVTLGIRPEAVTLCPQGQSGSGLAGTVSVVTVIQPNVYVTVQVGAHAIMVRLPDGVGWPRPGETAELEVDGDKLHLFDAKSGERLGTAGRAAPSDI
ncbi:hypothetical protein LCGC14_3129230, partial [marine sediment metagenome]